MHVGRWPGSLGVNQQLDLLVAEGAVLDLFMS